ncbi:MAG: SDR family oxidoreductase [Mycobacterium sp.]|nr:SDR family oxidoreductase [Mycobacterium sp.]
MKLANQTALITGASGGIGEEFARQFAQRGANLILVARRADKLDQLRNELLERSSALTIDVVTADLSVPGSAAELAAKVDVLGRRVDILVNNAGVGQHGEFVEQDRAANASQVQLNCVTLVELTALYLPAMTRAGHGLVINVASTAGFQPTPGMAVYGATKAFVLSFTEALWQETKSTGVRIFALCPGATETEFFARTGEEFLTRGRQTSQQVVDVAMAAIDKSTPTVISGLRNAILANGYRIAPRRVMLEVAQRMVKAE